MQNGIIRSDAYRAASAGRAIRWEQVNEFVVPVDHAVIHIRPMFREVEKHHVPGRRINLEMRADTVATRRDHSGSA